MVSNFKKLKLFVDIALRTAEESYCKRLQVGCVIVKNDRIIGYGYNGTPKGMDNCCEDNDITKTNVIHAEMNAILKVANSTESLKDAVLIVTHAPCETCASAILNTDIKDVVFINTYRSDSGIKTLREAKLNIYHFHNDNNTLTYYNSPFAIDPLHIRFFNAV